MGQRQLKQGGSSGSVLRMSDFGRIHCIVVATKSGEVVFERYYDRYTELEKAEIREAFQQATDHINLAHDNHEFVGSFR